MSKRASKKDFDMERMYQKLIPSLQAEGLSFSELISQGEDAQAPAAVSKAEAPANLMEMLLREKMEHTMKMLRACDCRRCRSDILAIALNQLPSAYAVDGERFEERILELRRSYEIKATSALILAVQTVKADPHH